MEDRNKLSENKQKFLEEERIIPAWTVDPTKWPEIIAHYEKNLSIKIHLNGTTPFGQKTLDQKRRSNLKFDDKTINLALFVQEQLIKDDMKLGAYSISNHPECDFKKFYPQIKAACSEYLENGMVRKNLTEEELRQLNSKLSKQQLGEKCYKKLKKESNAYFYGVKNNLRLSKQEAIEEIHQLQQTLEDNTFVGYIYTPKPTEQYRNQHNEVFILSKNTIIKPVDWGHMAETSLDPEDINGLYFNPMREIMITGVNAEGKLIPKRYLPLAQAGGDECGTLGIAYLKELLKEDAKQLRHSALMFPYYSSEDKKDYFFLTSPQPLRYSQSETYNNILETIVAKNEEVVIAADNQREYTITPLQELLENSLKIARSKNDSEMIKENERMLEKLTTFRNKWLEEYTSVKDKRKQSKKDTLFGSKALLYKTKQIEKIAYDHPDYKKSKHTKKSSP